MALAVNRVAVKHWAGSMALALVLASPQALAAPPRQCPSLPPPYDGALFDAMTQIDERISMSMSEAMAQVKAAGIAKVALFARSRKWLGQNEDDVLALAREFPALVIIGAPKYFQLRDDLDQDYIEATIAGIKTHGYAFVGEILYSHADKSHGKQTARGERYVDPLAPGTARFLARLKPLRVPLMTHWEVYDWARDWPRFSRLYAAWPEQIFIIPHMGFGKAAQMRAILERHPNVVVTLSKKEKDQRSMSAEKTRKIGRAVIDGCGALKPEWRNLLNRFSDRVLFATDAHKNHRWNIYGKSVRRQRRILGQLSPKIAARIAYKNAQRVYGVKISLK